MRLIIYTTMFFTVSLVAVTSLESPDTPATEVPTPDITTTTVHSTTTKIPSTSTTVPKTTTTVPKTTTTAPNTTTTAVPTTTTAVPSTTTDVPSTTPQPVDEGKWNVTDGNITCIIVEIRAEFTITRDNVTMKIPLPPTAFVDPRSTCDLNNTQILALTFEDDTLELVFEKDSDHVWLRNITFDTRIAAFRSVFYNDTKLFPVKVGNSYMCRTSESIPLMGTLGDITSITLEIKSIRVQAFRTEQEDDFGTADECTADEIISDIVPIAVACALAILIVIVLIAYLVGRRRIRQKGYTSV